MKSDRNSRNKKSSIQSTNQVPKEPLKTVAPFRQFDDFPIVGSMFGPHYPQGLRAPDMTFGCPGDPPDIELADVSLWCDGSATLSLNHVSLLIKGGEFVHLTGAAASGKTMLARVIAGLSQPHSGTARIAGHDVWTLPLGESRHPVDLITRDSVLLSAPVYCAVTRTFIAADIDYETYQDAVRLTGADRIAARLAHGDRTWIGINGVHLSAAEMELLLLTSVVARNAPIVIIDNPLSELDDQMRRHLRQQMPKIMEGRTVIVTGRGKSLFPGKPRRIRLVQGRVQRPRRRLQAKST